MKTEFLSLIVKEVAAHFRPNPQLATFKAVRSVCMDAMIDHYGRVVCASHRTLDVVDDLAESVLDHLGLN